MIKIHFILRLEAGCQDLLKPFNSLELLADIQTFALSSCKSVLSSCKSVIISVSFVFAKCFFCKIIMRDRKPNAADTYPT